MPEQTARTEERFETFTESGTPLGLVARSVVHAQGLWHRSVHVFLFDGAGRLHLQRRVADKDVCPGRWDLSAAEHLQPGEPWLTGALRGLEEELGVTGAALTPLGDPARFELSLPGLGILDREFQQAFQGVWDGPLNPDPKEIAEVRTLDLATLAEEMRGTPEAFTPWFARDVVRCGVLPAA